MKKLYALMLIALLPITGCAQSLPDEDEILNRTSVLTTIYPDGTVYQSEDNGITWTRNGEEYGVPDVYLSLQTDQPLDHNSLLHKITFHNNGLEDGVYFEGSMLHFMFRSDDGWIEPEKIDGSENIRMGPYGTVYEQWATDWWMFLPAYEGKTGRYKYECEVDGYICIAEFTVIAQARH